MLNKYKISISLLQVICGILATLVFIQYLFNGSKIEMTVTSFIIMISGLFNGIRGLSR